MLATFSSHKVHDNNRDSHYMKNETKNEKAFYIWNAGNFIMGSLICIVLLITYLEADNYPNIRYMTVQEDNDIDVSYIQPSGLLRHAHLETQGELSSGLP